MAKKPTPKPEPSTDLALFGVVVDIPDGEDSVVQTSTTDQPLLVLTQPDVRKKLFAEIEAEVAAFVPDLSTDTSRKAIASLAYKVARTKTAIDKAGLKATEDARAMISNVNRERTVVSTQLEILQTKAREPLTKWEAAEAERLRKVNQAIADVRTAGEVRFDDTSEDIARRVTALKAMQDEIANPVAEQFWGDHLPVYTGALQGSLSALDAAFTRISREEEDRRELERLRTAEREREEREAEEQRQRDAQAEADRIKAEAEARESQRKAQAAEEARQAEIREREAAERAADAARSEETRRATEAQIERDRQHEAEIEAQRQETARLQKAEDDRKEAERIAEEERKKREADQEHRSKIMGEAKRAIMSCGVDEPTAKAIVLAIKAQEIPHVSIAF